MRIERKRLRHFVVAAAGVIGMAAAEAATPYAVTILQVPDAAYSSAWGINNAGAIVGDFLPADPDSSALRGFLFKDGVYTTLYGPTGALGAHAMGITDSGVILGNYYSTRNSNGTAGPSSGFIYANGSYMSFDVPGAIETDARGISPDGRYVSGYYLPASGGLATGFVWDRTAQTFTDVAGTAIVIHGITSSGLALGSERLKPSPNAPSIQEGFTYDLSTGQRSHYLLQAQPGSPEIYATAFRGINASGTVAGFFDQQQVADGDPYRFAFVGTPDDYAVFGIPGAAQTAAEGINNAGVVVGNYEDWDANQWAIVATPVPEPASWLLMLSGAGLIAARRRKA